MVRTQPVLPNAWVTLPQREQPRQAAPQASDPGVFFLGTHGGGAGDGADLPARPSRLPRVRSVRFRPLRLRRPRRCLRKRPQPVRLPAEILLPLAPEPRLLPRPVLRAQNRPAAMAPAGWGRRPGTSCAVSASLASISACQACNILAGSPAIISAMLHGQRKVGT